MLFSYLVFTVIFVQWGSALPLQGVFWIAAFVGLVNGFVTQRLFVWKSRGPVGAQLARFLLFNISFSALNAVGLELSLLFFGGNPLIHQALFNVFFAGLAFVVSRDIIFVEGSEGRAHRLSREGAEAKRVDVFLQYYFPHVSGLTNMAVELAEYAAITGWKVHVHATGNETACVKRNSVDVHTYKKWFRVGRAAFSPGLALKMIRLRKQPLGIVHVHMPFPDSLCLSLLLPKGTRLVVTYHCDSPMGGFGQALVSGLLDSSQKNLLRRADRVVFSSKDYAEHSRSYRHLKKSQVSVIPVTCRNRSGGEPRFRVEDMRLIGFLGRPTQEKGIDVLLDAMDLLPPDVGLLFAGPETDLSEKPHFQEEKMKMLEGDGRVFRTGFLAESEVPDFYSSVDVFVFPSVNSFEAFGIVQVEAISAAVPVVSSDLPGVRTIAKAAKAGEIARVGDPSDLAEKISSALEAKYDMKSAQAFVASKYLFPRPHVEYERLYQAIRNETLSSHPPASKAGGSQ